MFFYKLSRIVEIAIGLLRTDAMSVVPRERIIGKGCAIQFLLAFRRKRYANDFDNSEFNKTYTFKFIQNNSIITHE